MIVSRTPLRISLFGGGTDYPEYFRRKRGVVIGMGIDKYVYVTAMPLSELHPYKYRLYWSKIERCQTVEEITHPVVREVCKLHAPTNPMGYSIIADLPALNGLGSSSAFTVGFILAMIRSHNNKGLSEQPDIVARMAIDIERITLKENGGWQDQYLCAHGGFNRFDFDACGVVKSPVYCTWTNELVESLFLIHTGDSRFSSDVCAEQCARNMSRDNDDMLDSMRYITDSAHDLLEESFQSDTLDRLGELMNAGWNIKKHLSSVITNAKIDELYKQALYWGASGGKLCGAGAGGFLLVVVPPYNRKFFLNAMRNVTILPVKLAESGAKIVME